MTTTTDSLTRAISYLNAVEVAPGRYAFKFEAGDYGIAFPSQLQTLGRALARQDGKPRYALADAYDYWVCNVTLVSMPSWWTPEHLFVWRSGNKVTFAAEGPSQKAWDQGGPPWVLYSADLKTGKEIPA